MSLSSFGEAGSRQGFSVWQNPGYPGLALQIRLAWNSQRSACLCLPSTGIQGGHHHIQPEPELLTMKTSRGVLQPVSVAAADTATVRSFSVLCKCDFMGKT